MCDPAFLKPWVAGGAFKLHKNNRDSSVFGLAPFVFVGSVIYAKLINAGSSYYLDDVIVGKWVIHLGM